MDSELGHEMAGAGGSDEGVMKTRWGDVRLDECAPLLREEIERLGDADPFESQLDCVGRLRVSLAGRSPEALAWRPAAGEWSGVEVLAHLVHTEVVYGYRYRAIAADPGGPIAGYDQEQWTAALPDAERAVAALLDELEALKRVNVGFLSRLSPAQRAHWGLHSERGRESIQALIGAIAGHDLLHQHQIEANLAAYDAMAETPAWVGP